MSTTTSTITIETEQSLAQVLSNADCRSVTAASFLSNGFDTLSIIKIAVNDPEYKHYLLDIGLNIGDIIRLRNYLKLEDTTTNGSSTTNKISESDIRSRSKVI
ncbi:hypothetical protein PPL_04171 [Heterostelium album PN500]|uniref:Uncharacterized protein n=1 Tax=Heterostelium pallidum (strain ATCC 26659 / Pp 5 / PN500) TaxID=670386 RepID=D3B680_HETP5|nr:hypothetical protein PPL_04171 [Heterostelium album PN500]EFA83378.1 hypothetical protein PPL_04171 [Heterostelium album PN500]|eukprot:XP_020435495.1 hypothetical protein PPL_04171 [Heterostelium album PN500]